jgi:hypothetical protein
MKKAEKHIGEKVNRTLQALEGMGRARPKPFLYTRIQARREKGAEMPQQTFILSPVFQRTVLVMIMLVILFNIYIMTRYLGGSAPDGTLSTSELLFIDEYYPSTPTLFNINPNDSNP